MVREARAVNVHAAKTQLSRLLVDVENGAEIVIARDGKPVARLVPIEPAPRRRRVGMLEGRAAIPDDFDTMQAEEIAALFDGAV